MISALDRVSPPWRQIDRLSMSGPGANDLLGAQRYVEAHTSPGEHVLILGTTLDHRVADRAGVVNVSPINGETALITPAEADRALDQLEDEGGDLVFEPLSGAQGASRFPSSRRSCVSAAIAWWVSTPCPGFGSGAGPAEPHPRGRVRYLALPVVAPAQVSLEPDVEDDEEVAASHFPDPSLERPALRPVQEIGTTRKV